MLETWPPQPTDVEKQELVGRSVDWAASHGLVMRYKNTGENNIPSCLAVHAPFALFPSPFPKSCYDHAIQLQPLFNKLVHVVANDTDFVANVIGSLSGGVDDFTWRLFEIFKSNLNSPFEQRIRLSINRSDYMLHVPSSESNPVIQQVELNTIASSFSSLSTLVSRLHSHMASRTEFFNGSATTTPDITKHSLPENNSILGIPKALGIAWRLYKGANGVATNPVVVMVVQPGEGNIFDQRWIEYELFQSYGVKLLRRSLAELNSSSKLVGIEKRLFM